VSEWNAHTAPVWGLDIAKSGDYAVSAAWDSSIRIWDLKGHTGTATKELKGHTGQVYATRIIDNQSILSAGEDGTIRCWDTDNSSIKYSIDVQFDPESANSAKVQKRAAQEAEGEPDTRIKLELSNRPTIYSMSVSKDSKYVILGCDDYSVKQVSLNAPEEGNPAPYPNLLTSKLRHKGAVYCTALTDEERVISGSGDNKVFMWDMSRDEPVLEMLGHEASVHCIDVMANGRSLLTGSFDHTVQRWDTLSGSSVQKLVVSDKDANVNAVAEVSGGIFIAAGTSDGLVRVFDLRKAEVPLLIIGEKRSGWEVGQDIVSVCAVAVQGKSMICGYSDGQIKQIQVSAASKRKGCIIS